MNLYFDTPHDLVGKNFISALKSSLRPPRES